MTDARPMDAGGLGLAAIQIIEAAGALPIATAGNSEKRRYLRKQGVLTTVNSRTTEFSDLLYRQLPSKPPQVVLNSLTSPGSALLLNQCTISSLQRIAETSQALSLGEVFKMPTSDCLDSTEKR